MPPKLTCFYKGTLQVGYSYLPLTRENSYKKNSFCTEKIELITKEYFVQHTNIETIYNKYN